jgi:hypothetical protein
MAMTMTPTTAAVMSSVPTDKAGVGSAVLNSARQVGGSLGIAVMGAVVAGQIHVPRGSVAFPPEFVSGYHDALYLAASIAFAGGAVAVATVRQVSHREAGAVAAEAA